MAEDQTKLKSKQNNNQLVLQADNEKQLFYPKNHPHKSQRMIWHHNRSGAPKQCPLINTKT